MSAMTERFRRLTGKKGESLIYVMGVMMFLVIICFSVTAAAVTSMRYVVSQKEYNDFLVLDNSIHKSIMFSLQSNSPLGLGRQIGEALATLDTSPTALWRGRDIDVTFPGSGDFNFNVNLSFINDPIPVIPAAMPAEYFTGRRWIRCNRRDYCSNSCLAAQGTFCTPTCGCAPSTPCNMECNRPQHYHGDGGCNDLGPGYTCNLLEHECTTCVHVDCSLDPNCLPSACNPCLYICGDDSNICDPVDCALFCQHICDPPYICSHFCLCISCSFSCDAHHTNCNASCSPPPTTHIECNCGAGPAACTVEARERRENLRTEKQFLTHRIPRTATIVADMAVTVSAIAADGRVFTTTAIYEFSGSELSDCLRRHGECPIVSGANCNSCGGTCPVPPVLACCMREGIFDDNPMKFTPGNYGTWRLVRYETT